MTLESDDAAAETEGGMVAVVVSVLTNTRHTPPAEIEDSIQSKFRAESTEREERPEAAFEKQRSARRRTQRSREA